MIEKTIYVAEYADEVDGKSTYYVAEDNMKKALDALLDENNGEEPLTIRYYKNVLIRE